MTNKTIIGGIDVSECDNYDHEQYFECKINCCHCEDLQNCYFKQLARAKEEIKKLNAQLMQEQQEDDRGYCETYDCKYYDNLEDCQKQNCWYKCYSKVHTKNVQLKKQLQAKEQECEELKKKKEENEKFYLTKYTNKDSYCLELEHERNIYKQALDEIEKTINEDDFNLCPINDSCDCHRGLDKDILDIINKAKDGE